MAVFDFQKDVGATPSSSSLETAQANSALLEGFLQNLTAPSTLFIPPSTTFYLMGGIFAEGVSDFVLHLDGRLRFVGLPDQWPQHPGKVTKKGVIKPAKPKECIELHDIHNVTITSSLSSRNVGDRGVLDGGGPAWWGLPLIGYMQRGTLRPHLLYIKGGSDVVIENVVFKDSPRWTVVAHDMAGLTIRDCSVVARRTPFDGHNLIDLSAFNTDGFDVAGHDVHIHDCDVWNQDDCIAVKDSESGSYNMLFERINASGTGLVIGSIGTTHVRNITFRDSYLHRSYKGIFMKFRSGDVEQPGIIEDVLYEVRIREGALISRFNVREEIATTSPLTTPTVERAGGNRRY
jgi:polygalacturonase